MKLKRYPKLWLDFRRLRTYIAVSRCEDIASVDQVPPAVPPVVVFLEIFSKYL